MKRFAFSVVLVASVGVIACDNKAVEGPDPTPSAPGDAAAGGDAAVSNVIDAGSFTITSPKPGFQTKSAAQLLSTFKACFGPASLLVKADMVQGGATTTTPILGSTFAASTAVGVNDIVTVQRNAFDGDDSLLRLGTRADALSLEYVTAQRNVANVVAANCTAANLSPLCACATLPDATAMVRRCLPQLDPASGQFLDASQKLQTRCALKPAEAIASFVASAALSKLP